MDQSPAWEADRPSARQEIPCLLWSVKVHYRIHKNQDWSFSIILLSVPKFHKWSLLFRFSDLNLCVELLLKLLFSYFLSALIWFFLSIASLLWYSLAFIEVSSMFKLCFIYLWCVHCRLLGKLVVYSKFIMTMTSRWKCVARLGHTIL